MPTLRSPSGASLHSHFSALCACLAPHQRCFGLEHRPSRSRRPKKRSRSNWRWLAILITALCASSIGLAMDASLGGPLPLPLFPSNNWWNLDVSTWPVDPDSASYIAFVNNGGNRRLHPDLGGRAPTTEQPTASYGIPYVVVSNVQPADLVAVEFRYSSESDGVDRTTGRSFPFYPIPIEARTEPYWLEGGVPANVDLRDSQDRHLLLVDADQKYLYELYNLFYDSAQARWLAGSGAFFDLNTNSRRPETWTSADAAGLAILPGLVRYDEVYNPSGAEIGHAFRVTVRATDGYVYPASHRAGSRAGALPMGARLRLRPGIDPAERSSDPNMQRIYRAMQKHGLIVADNGSDMYVTGTYDPRWNNAVLNPAFRALTASDFEVLRVGYNPPAPRATRPAANLRARLGANALLLAWDSSPGAAGYQVHSAERLGAVTSWQVVAESAEPGWTGALDLSRGGRFYRVLAVE